LGTCSTAAAPPPPHAQAQHLCCCSTKRRSHAFALACRCVCSGPRKASGEPGREPGSDGLPLCQHRRPLDLASADQGRALSRGGLAPEQTKGSAAPSQSSSSSCRRVSFAGDCPLEAPAGGLPCTSSSQPDAALGAPLGVWGPAPSGQLPLKQQQQQQRDGAQTHQGDGQEVPPQEQVPARRPSPSILEQPSAGTTSGGMCGQAPHPPVGAATPPTQSTRPTPGQLVLSARGQDHGPDPGAPARHSQDGHAQCLAAAPLPSPQRSAATSGLRQDAPSASSPSALQQLTQRCSLLCDKLIAHHSGRAALSCLACTSAPLCPCAWCCAAQGLREAEHGGFCGALATCSCTSSRRAVHTAPAHLAFVHSSVGSTHSMPPASAKSKGHCCS